MTDRDGFIIWQISRKVSLANSRYQDAVPVAQKRIGKALGMPRYLGAQVHSASIPGEPPAKGIGGVPHSWGTQLLPWEIASNGQLWLEEHLSMTNVREGFRCAHLTAMSRFSAASQRSSKVDVLDSAPLWRVQDTMSPPVPICAYPSYLGFRQFAISVEHIGPSRGLLSLLMQNPIF